MLDAREALAASIKTGLHKFADKKGIVLPEEFLVLLERPKREGQGDWATNIAMQLSKVFGMSPRQLAEGIIENIDKGNAIEKIEVAGPGFMNFYLTSSWIAEALHDVLEKKSDYGRCNIGKGRKVQVEFVSANPTGPLHLGHGRGAAVGDIITSILSFCGWDAEREYYINDAGLQMENLGKSTQSAYFTLCGRDDVPYPEDGYRGDYIDDIAKSIKEKHGDSLTQKPLDETLTYFTDETARIVLETIRKDLEDFGVDFDVWFSEKSLYEGTVVPTTIEKLKQRGYAYDENGAVWFKSTAFGDDKDRVMIRANGVPTYFTSDIAYLQNKYDRGFEWLIYIWGADHHGYVPRIHSVNEALGKPDEALKILLIQFVSLLRNGVPVAMSKRAGTYVTLREVIDEVGADATRFNFVNRRADSHLDFDLELAKKASSDNPVYYVQYAHARICSILREMEARGIKFPSIDEMDLSVLAEAADQNLVKIISRFPEEVMKAGEELAPHRIAFYTHDLAEAFHSFYNVSKILGEPDNVRNSRLILIEATRITLRSALDLLGVSAPERM